MTRNHLRRPVLCLLALLCLLGSNLSPATGETLYNGIVTPSPWPPQATNLNHCYPNATLPYYLQNPPAVIPIDVGRQLFVDDFLVQSTTLTRTHHLAEYYAGNPVLVPDGGAYEGTVAMPFSDGVWWDPSVRRFKMFYDGKDTYTCMAQSSDGIHWTRTPTGHPGGGNLVGPSPIVSTRDSGMAWLDLSATDPNYRYRFTYYRNGMHNCRSADGVIWTLTIPGDDGWNTGGQPKNTAWDRSTFFYNPFRGKWVFSCRNNSYVRAGGVRARLYWETTDWSQKMPTDWSNMWWMVADLQDEPDPRYGALTELYNLDAAPYESLMLGYFSIWHSDCHVLPAGDPQVDADRANDRPKLNAVKLGYSRDGWYWHRPDRRQFLPYSETAGAWNYGNVQSAGGSPLVIGDKLYIYCSGRNCQNDAPDAGEGSFAGLAFLRRDGFTSMDAGPAAGELLTRPVSFQGRRLFVNVDCPDGELRVEVQNAAGQVISPFSLANCQQVAADSTIYEVKWAGAADLSSLIGQQVRFRFQLTDGSLYAFWVSPDAAGASNGYMAAGGPGYSTNRDTAGKAAYAAAYVVAQVDAGIDQTVTLPATAALHGVVSNAGLPAGQSWTAAWSITSGPGIASFGNPAAADTSAAFSLAGTYILRLTITDGWMTAWSETTVTAQAAGNQWHVSPTGTSGGAGTQASPWDFKSALAKTTTVHPGDTIWVHGGEYSQTQLHCALQGESGKPILVRNWPGERPTIRSTLGCPGAPWGLPRYVWFWGLEIASRGWDVNSDNGVTISASSTDQQAIGIKLINCVVHDNPVTGIANWAYADDCEVNGNLVYYNGADETANPQPGVGRGHGHGMYIQSANGPKLVKDNIVFRNFDKGIQLYTTNAPRNFVTHTGNTLFNNSEISGTCDDDCDNLILWGYTIAQESHAFYNMTYAPPWAHSTAQNIGNSNNARIENNYFVASSGSNCWQVDNVNATNTGLVMNNNTFYGALTGFTLNQYGTGNVQLSARPATAKIFVRRNDWEPGRANITVYNWPMAGTVNVDISSVGLPVGMAYEVRDVQNYFGPAVAAGTYTGLPITLPMTGLTVAAPQGLDPNIYHTPPHTDAEFGVFVLQATTQNGNFPPGVNAGADQGIMLPAAASLDGTVSDDGLPNPPQSVTVAWTKQSGPGTVTFGNAAAADTTAAFSDLGTYVLRLTAGDSEYSAFDEVTVIVNPPGVNSVPTVSAGADAAIALPAAAGLDGTISDDGLPNPPHAVTATWSVVSGPGTVTFTNPAAADTAATFSTAGTYLLRLTASDSELSAFDDVVLTVNPRVNLAPAVSAGTDRSSTWPANTVSLDATVSDDSLPTPPAAVTVAWTRVSGPGSVTFTNAAAIDTTATFSTSGVYTLRLTAGDSALAGQDDVVVTIYAEGSDLLMRLPMNEGAGATAADVTGQGHHATLVNSPTWIAHDDGYAVHLDATSTRQHLTVADFDYGPEFTLSFWFRLDHGNAGTVDQYVFAHGSSVVITVNEASNPSNPNRVITAVRDSTDSSATNMFFPAPLDGGWHLYTLTVKAPTGCKVYLDANEAAVDASHGGDAIVPTGAIYLGTRYDLSTARLLDGALDDVRLYSRALSGLEVAALMTPPNGAPTVSAGPDKSITLPASSVSLDGTVSDDGLPAACTSAWSVVSGPGAVSFANPAAAMTAATFFSPGTYVLRLTASDTAVSAQDDVSVTVGKDLRADFNADGTVDGLDFLRWQAGFPTPSGATHDTGDANGDGKVDGLDFLLWQTGFQP